MCSSSSFNIDQLLANHILFIFPYTSPLYLTLKQIKAEIHICMNILLCTYKILGFLQYVSLKDKYLKKKKNTIPWRRKWQPTPVFLPGEFHGQRSLMGCHVCNCKELDTTEQLTLLPFFHLSNYQKEKKGKNKPPNHNTLSGLK